MSGGYADAEEKERLVVMQVQGPDLSTSERTIYRTAIVKALSDRYIVLSGDDVDAKVREIFTKESRENISCDTEKCFQDIALAFQAELIATCTILRADGGYLVNLQVSNVIENRSVLAESEPCRECKKFDVIDKLKEMVKEGIQLAGKPESSVGIGKYKYTLNGLVGMRYLDKKIWSPVQEQSVLGIDINISKDKNPQFLIIGYSSSRSNSQGRTGSISELSASLGYRGQVEAVNSFMSIGIANIQANFSDENSSSTGLLFRTCRFYKKYENVRYGLDFRMLLATNVKFFGVNGDANYYQLGLILEWEL